MTIVARYFWFSRTARVLLFVMILLLAVNVAAVRSVRIQDVPRAAQIIRTSVSIDTAPQPEAIEGQTLRFIVRRSRTLRERTAISYRLDNMPTPQFRRAMPTVIIEAGQTTGEILIPTIDDALLNGDRNIVVTLLAASGNVALGNAQATGVIRDNERPPVPTADIEAAPTPSVMEGETLAFTVRLRAAMNNRTLLRYQIVDSTDASSAPDLGRIVIDPGSTEAVLSIPTYDDAIVNGERTLQIRLTAISGDGKLGVARAQGVVLDNDKATITPRFSILPNGNAVEGEELSFTVFADSAMPNARRVPIAVTAPPGALIEPVPSSTLLQAGETSAIVTLLTADDAVLTDTRAVQIALTPSEGLLLDLAQSSASATISDNDKAAVSIETGSSSGADSPLPPDTTDSDTSSGRGAILTDGPVPAIAAAVLLVLGSVWGAKRYILPRFYTVGWDMGVPHDVDATSSGAISLLPPGGGVEIDLGAGEAVIVGPCQIVSEEERDDPDD